MPFGLEQEKQRGTLVARERIGDLLNLIAANVSSYQMMPGEQVTFDYKLTPQPTRLQKIHAVGIRLHVAC